MDSKELQIDFVKRQLMQSGRVSRNQCLRHFISRLSSIIFRLRERYGMEFSGEYVDKTTPFGKDRDFVYKWTNPTVEIKTQYFFNYIDESNNESNCPITADSFEKACSIFLMQPPIFLFALEEEVLDNFNVVHLIESDLRFKDFRTYQSKKKEKY